MFKNCYVRSCTIKNIKCQCAWLFAACIIFTNNNSAQAAHDDVVPLPDVVINKIVTDWVQPRNAVIHGLSGLLNNASVILGELESSDASEIASKITLLESVIQELDVLKGEVFIKISQSDDAEISNDDYLEDYRAPIRECSDSTTGYS